MGEASSKSWLEVEGYPFAWTAEHARDSCEQLEAGAILYFARPPFALSDEDRSFLLQQQPGGSRLHKNVSYKPRLDTLSGFAGPEQARMHAVMSRYSRQVTGFITALLSPYQQRWTVDFASFRPIEEEGRKLPLHKRNDLLHVDAFPTRPTRGGRILRVFTNIHSQKSRLWLTGERFAQLAPRLARDAGLDGFARSGGTHPLLRLLRVAPNRSAYDKFMLRFHDWLKENEAFQREAVKIRSDFPPMATWLVYTDGLPHAVLSGQYALEQTFIVPVEALVAPQHAPIRVLEKLAGAKLA